MTHHPKRLSWQIGISHEAKPDAKTFKVTDDFVMPAWEGLPTHGDKRFILQLFRLDRLPDSKPMTCWQAHHQRFFHELSREEISLMDRQKAEADVQFALENSGNHLVGQQTLSPDLKRVIGSQLKLGDDGQQLCAELTRVADAQVIRLHPEKCPNAIYAE